MRTALVTSVAANITGTTASVLSGAAPAAASGGDDGFAAMLGDATAAPGNDAAASATTDTSAPSTINSILQSISANVVAANDAADGNAATCRPMAAKPVLDVDAPAEPDLPAPDAPATRFANAGNTLVRPNVRAASPRATVDATAIDTNTDTAPAPADTTLAQLLAAQQAMPVPNTPVANMPVPPKGDDADDAAASDPVAAATAASAPATDIAASAILTGGATVKPGQDVDDKAPAGDQKSEKQASTASALADLGKVRLFDDPKATLPIHAGSALPRNNSQAGNDQSGGSPSGQQNPANTPAVSAPAPAADAANTFTPAHAQTTAPQPDASAAITAASASTAPTAPAVASAPAPVAAQIHFAHPAAQPDINTLAFNIAAKSEGGARHFDIRLDPAELGRVDVRLTVDDAGQAQATLSVEKPHTLELLQKDQTHLERALKDAGLDLTQNGLSFSLKGQQQQNANGGNDPSPRGRQLAVRAIAAAGEAASTLSYSGIASSDGRLDIRV